MTNDLDIYQPSPSGKFGVWPRNDGGAHVAFYAPDGKTLLCSVDFDARALGEFRQALNEIREAAR